MEKPDLSLYHPNLLHLQIDVVLFSFHFFNKKGQIGLFYNTNLC